MKALLDAIDAVPPVTWPQFGLVVTPLLISQALVSMIFIFRDRRK